MHTLLSRCRYQNSGKKKESRFSRAWPKVATLAPAGDGTSPQQALDRLCAVFDSALCNTPVHHIATMKVSITLPSVTPVCRATGRCDTHVNGLATLPKVSFYCELSCYSLLCVIIQSSCRSNCSLVCFCIHARLLDHCQIFTSGKVENWWLTKP